MQNNTEKVISLAHAYDHYASCLYDFVWFIALLISDRYQGSNIFHRKFSDVTISIAAETWWIIDVIMNSQKQQQLIYAGEINHAWCNNRNNEKVAARWPVGPCHFNA
jgi:hypothetical protein